MLFSAFSFKFSFFSVTYLFAYLVQLEVLVVTIGSCYRKTISLLLLISHITLTLYHMTRQTRLARWGE